MVDTRMWDWCSRFDGILCISCSVSGNRQVLEEGGIIIQNYRVQARVVCDGYQNFVRDFVALADESGKTDERIAEARIALWIVFQICTCIICFER